MSRENNFFVCDSCEWSNTNYNECLCPLPWCPVCHFLFLSADWDDLDWWERWFRSTLLTWFYGFTIAQVVWFSYCYSALIAFDFSAEVGCHLNACLTSFVFPRPFDPRWIRIHLTSLKLSLFLFYIPRHVVCCDCNGIGWIATRLVDCMIEWSCWGSFLWSVCVHQLWVIR